MIHLPTYGKYTTVAEGANTGKYFAETATTRPVRQPKVKRMPRLIPYFPAEITLYRFVQQCRFCDNTLVAGVEAVVAANFTLPNILLMAQPNLEIACEATQT